MPASKIRKADKSKPQFGYGFEHLDPNKPNKCAECGTMTMGKHHVVPWAVGGTKVVPMCGECHGKVHAKPDLANASTSIKEGLQRAKERGQRLGPPKKITPEIAAQAKDMRVAGCSYKMIANRLGLSVGAIYSAINEK